MWDVGSPVCGYVGCVNEDFVGERGKREAGRGKKEEGRGKVEK